MHEFIAAFLAAVAAALGQHPAAAQQQQQQQQQQQPAAQPGAVVNDPRTRDLGSDAYSIMPMGDSITLGLASTDGQGYRKFLDQLLAGRPHTFVGTQGTAPMNHEGHSGWTIDQLGAEARRWVALKRPDIILIHAGTNDDGLNHTTAQMLASMNHLLDEIHAGSPTSYVIVAKIPLTPFNNQWQQDQEVGYNAGLPAVAAARSHVIVVDMVSTQISADSVGAERVHPNDTGYKYMAQVWYNALPRVS
ncbi:SGNH/GDSL hydrolase family protein [Dactylosporangium sp. CS-033363]|uniref:SGNH/GDSL hydrolase family protein n=1 Tax=Dactylosporangium sp. CS-033363 TaxID=3239935 RepID=UPI003D8D37C2